MIRTRPARLEELPFLQATHSQVAEQRGFEQLDLSKSVVIVAEDTTDGMRCGLLAARLIWQFEPLVLFPPFERTSTGMAKKRATYLLARAGEAYIADPSLNCTPIRSFFAVIQNSNPRMQNLAEHIGWQRVYPKCKIFGKDT